MAAEVNARLLDRPEFLEARDYSEFPDTVIIPPVSIGRGCQISHSIIGPNVAVGDKTTSKNYMLTDSIIGTYSELQPGCFFAFEPLGYLLNMKKALLYLVEGPFALGWC